MSEFDRWASGNGDSDPAAELRRKSLIAVGAVVIVLALGAMILFASGTDDPPPPTATSLKDLLSEYERTISSGDAGRFMEVRQEIALLILERVAEFTPETDGTEDLSRLWRQRNQVVCDLCTLVPRAAKALLEPIPASVRVNMTQLDVDIVEGLTRPVREAVEGSYLPKLRTACEPYVDEHGNIKMAK